MSIKLGSIKHIEAINNSTNLSNIARVVAVHKERYLVRNEENSFKAEITGNMRFTATQSSDFPAVGDWVEIMPMDNENAVIVQIYQRKSMLQRQAVGDFGNVQLIAANIDYCFVVMSVDQNFNMNRIDRYLAISNAGNIRPIVLLTKTDLATESSVAEMKKQLMLRHDSLPIYTLSIEDEAGFVKFSNNLEVGKTYCFVGSSGVGKSTLLNRLLGENVLVTNSISQSNQKGKHTTTHRELFVLDGGSILIDTPGMREVGVVDNAGGIESTFDRISDLARQCRFSDCNHINEVGCAVLAALKNGELSEGEYNSYIKLKKEQEHFSETQHEKREKGKQFSKMAKGVKAMRKNMKY